MSKPFTKEREAELRWYTTSAMAERLFALWMRDNTRDPVPLAALAFDFAAIFAAEERKREAAALPAPKQGQRVRKDKDADTDEPGLLDQAPGGRGE